jgi:hypothetical protein
MLIPLWIKIAYTLMVALIVPIYTVKYGWRNFLWFSDICMLGLVAALWLENALINSMLSVGVLIPEMVWFLSYFGRLFFGIRITGLAEYMFDTKLPLFLRGLSLYHVVLPPVLIYLLFQLGYDERALWAQTILAWSVLVLCYLITDPKENVNWVFGFGVKPQNKIHPVLYLVLLMLAFLILIFIPTHFLLKWLF